MSALNCPFIHSEAANPYELYTYVVPVLLLLMSNFVFSIWIMAVSTKQVDFLYYELCPLFLPGCNFQTEVE